MANKLYEEKDVARIAKSLNTHSGDDRGYRVSEMADGIDTFVGGIKHRLDDIIDRQGEILDLEMAPESPVYDVSEGLEYSFNGNFYEVIGRGSCTDTVIVIPKNYDDGEHGERRVTGITGKKNVDGLPAEGAFQNDETIEEIILPETGVTFRHDAFRGSSLKIIRNYSGGDSFWSLGLNLKYVSMIDGTNIELFDFYDVSSGVTLDFSRHTSVPTLRDVSFITAHEGLRILVPEGLYDEWVSENSTNWVALKDYIYPVTVSPEKVMDKIDMVEDCVEDVYEKGKQAEYDAFWDAFQQYGLRAYYHQAFYGVGWNDVTFKPKYDIAPTDKSGAQLMFRGSSITNLKNIMEQCGVKFDFSKQVDTTNVFYGATKITDLPIIDVSNSNSIYNIFGNCSQLKNVDKLVLSSICTNGYSAFDNCESLENITFDGVIATKNLNLQWATKLSKASMQSLIGVYTYEVDGLTLTLSLASVNKAFETSEGANDGSTSAEWANLVASKMNLTVTLV